MSKYKFTNEELELLRVAKLNQNQSESIKSEMELLNKSWEENNQSHEAYLEKIEKQLAIINMKKYDRKPEFVRESTHEEPLDWENLVKNANRVMDYDVDFEDLLNQEEFVSAYKHIKEIDIEFEKKTGLRKKDFVFLTVAIALQCTRQYVIDPWIKKQRVTAGANDEKGRKGNTESGWYYVDKEKILINRVPYDVQRYGTNASIQKFLKGGDHRLMTLGHDPILGWIFGTANIMTSTVTRVDFMSAHVKCIDNENIIHSLADTMKVFESIFKRLSEEGDDAKLSLGSAVVREAIHLISDVNTKRSLPLPGVGALSPELGKKLAKYGIDTASVGTEVTLSCFINMLISMIHRICFDENKDDEQFYEVRTRKIILYSNLIASTSNTIGSVLTKRYDLLDVGGMLVTITRLITDVRFICKVKDEFVQNKLDEHFDGIQEEVENIYKSRFE
ncbi:hypothetical protein [Acetoanaerobium noterae]|uniref:hypothetical protein n=1 Tax=Acetoanaerobium noterae TaxID=745369 RepID=UPI0033286F5B